MGLEMTNLDERLDGAIARDDLPAVEDLLTRGANISSVDGLGWSPLMNAAWIGSADIVKLLLRKGADPFWINKQGQTVLDLLRELGELDDRHRKVFDLIDASARSAS